VADFKAGVRILFDMFFNALRLFLRGKLFRNPEEVLRQYLIGLAVCAACFLLLVVTSAPVWFCVGATALLGGLLQPWLFRNLKYD
jgi:Flp pilus assembly protein TadB